MAARVFIHSLTETTDRHVALGWQCPECFGIQVTTLPRQPHDNYRFTCGECGAQWSTSADNMRALQAGE